MRALRGNHCFGRDSAASVRSVGRGPSRCFLPPPRTGPLALLAALALLCVLGACSGPTAVREPGTDGDISLQISGPDALLVHEHALFTVRAVDKRGVQVPLPKPVVWSSSDPAVASVASPGVVTGLARGYAEIAVSVGAASATVPLMVTARIRLAPEGFPEWVPDYSIAVGDSLQFEARFVDVDGLPISEALTATWTSSDPASVSVTASGLVVGVQALSHAEITASTVEGVGFVDVPVSDVIAGLPATIRFANAAQGAGPVTFVPSKGPAVTLSFGESVRRPILSGLFHVETSVAGTRWGGMIRPDDRLSLYAVGPAPGVYLAATWASTVSVAADSALVSFLQGSIFYVVYLTSPGGPVSGPPAICYFDPGDTSHRFMQAAGDFDVILMDKFGYHYQARIRATAPGGHSITYVIVGTTPETAAVLAFPDL